MLSSKQLLEKKLGRKLTKEEYKIEERKLFEQWTEAIGDPEDNEPLSPEEQVCLLDEYDLHRK